MMRRLALVIVEIGCRGGFDAIDAGPTADVDNAVPGLVAHYTCDSLDANVLPDTTGHGHDGSCTTCPEVAVPGKIGAGACRFLGTGERVTIAPSSMSTYSIATWMFVDALSAITACAVNRTYGPADANSWQLCATVPDLYFYTVGASSPTLKATGSLAAGTWTHVIIEWD